MNAPTPSGPQIDIYVLQGDNLQTLHRTVCRLTEKIFGLGHRIHIQTASPLEAHQLNDLLWTFRDGGFLPHALHPAPPQDRSPIRIGHDGAPPDDGNVLINLAESAPAGFERFSRIAEVVDADPQRRNAGRRRYRQYQEHGVEPIVHKLG